MKAKPRIGDKVSVEDDKYPGVWIVKALGPVNATLMPEGGGIKLHAPYYSLKPPVASSEAAPVYYHAGELVRLSGGKYAGPDVWVVIADRGGDQVNVAKLGGDGGRYLRANRRGLVKVNPAEVLA